MADEAQAQSQDTASKQMSDDSQRLAALTARAADLEAKLLAREKADLEADAKHKDKLRADGDIKALLEARETDLKNAHARVLELDGDAKLGRGYRERESARIDAAKTSLSADQQKLVDAQGSIELKAALLDQFSALKNSAAAPAKPAISGGAPAPGVQTDWGAIKTREEFDHAKSMDAAGFAALVSGMFGKPNKTTTLDALFAHKNGKG